MQDNGSICLPEWGYPFCLWQELRDVKRGEKIAADGVIIGESSIGESTMTGRCIYIDRIVICILYDLLS